jgi:hypothetical protein
MNFSSSESGIKTHVLAVEPGEYMLESIMELIKSAGIRNGGVVSGIGTLEQCIKHMVKPGGQVSRSGTTLRSNSSECKASLPTACRISMPRCRTSSPQRAAIRTRAAEFCTSAKS